jgi:plastocyanin
LALTAFDLGFRETELTAAAGEIQIEYRNEGDLDHTLVFEGVGAAAPIMALPQSAERGAVKLEPGTYVYYCDLPGHRAAGMEGKLTVTQGGAGAAAGGGVADIVAQDLAFVPSEVTVPAGAVRINLKNEGELLHNVLFDGVADFAKVEAAGGSTASGTADLKPGTYVYFCDQPGHRAAGMEGTIIVGSP